MKLGTHLVTIAFSGWADVARNLDKQEVVASGTMVHVVSVQEGIIRGELVLWADPPSGYGSFDDLYQLWETGNEILFEDDEGEIRTVLWTSPFTVSWPSSEHTWTSVPIELLEVLT